ncbi:MAG: hypothetical protein ABSG03_32855 [Bryobacteraceae bacterium]|jgi:hypothetical protein
MRDWEKRVSSVGSKDDLAEFVCMLRDNLAKNREEWENTTLENFLEAMEAWIRVMDQSRKNAGKDPIESPSWQTVAEILLAAGAYE